MAPVVIAFGSNLGDRVGVLRRAVAALAGRLHEVDVSGLYESEPMYVLDQPPFLNGVLLAKTDLGPVALLGLLKRLERELGREVRARYGPREVDLDLVAYGSLSLRSPTLELPHPRWSERRFVVEPLGELARRGPLPPSLPVNRELEAMLAREPLSQQRLVRIADA